MSIRIGPQALSLGWLANRRSPTAIPAGHSPVPPVPFGTIMVISGTAAGGLVFTAYNGSNVWTCDQLVSKATRVHGDGTTDHFSVGGDPRHFCVAGVNIWSSNFNSQSISKIEPDGTVTTYSAGIGSGPNAIYAMAFDGTYLWGSIRGAAAVQKIGLDGVPVATYTGAGTSPQGIAYDGLNMWVACGGGTISKVAPDGTMTNYTVSGSPFYIAYDGLNMWTCEFFGTNVIKIAPDGTPTNYTVTDGSLPTGICYAGSHIWLGGYVAAGPTSSIIAVNPSNGAMQSFPSDINYCDASVGAFDGQRIWFGGASDARIASVQAV